MKNSPTFTERDDGRVTVDCWPDLVFAAGAFLRAPMNKSLMSKEDGQITFTVANGRAVYGIVAYYHETDEVEMVRLASELRPERDTEPPSSS